ncbi:MAG: hypothetical protein L6437_07595 [Kiritimatiellae bacterium]|nr:hypothetical protein [Verrucomicrobiota bacterium]MCG2660093.1 hypothetical protein [Kiritimatiellia bacterium]
MNQQKQTAAYAGSKFTNVPRDLAALLVSLKGFHGAAIGERDYRNLADSIVGTEPFTIILFTEPLAFEYARRKEYIETIKHQIDSELDETVFNNFGSEINENMFVFLRTHEDPEDVHLNRLIRQYYPKAKIILRQRHPMAWARNWKAGKYAAARIRIERRRRYDMPGPLCWGATNLPQQFYFMNSTSTYARGCSSGSGTREAHSYFGLAFIELSKRISIPSYILVYDRDNVLRFVARQDKFLIIPDSMGSNCEVDNKIVSALMRRAWQVKAVESPDYSRIREIRIFRR